MIIDDVHRVAFIHIPKCGGTSVGHQFRPLDSYEGRFRRPGTHPRLGPIHYSHIPLSFLRDEYPDEFEKVATYHAFAVLRDPHARFASAVCQRLEEFGGLAPLEITTDIATREARAVMDWLRARDRFCDLEYIHFSRQTDYVRLNGRQIVGHLYPLEDLSGLAASLQTLCGLAFDPERRENTNFVSTGGLLSQLRRFKPLYSRLTTWGMRERLLHLMQHWKLHTPSSLYDRFRRDPTISRFVEDYYAEDFAIRKIASDSHAAWLAGSAAPAAA
jgi:hypothetical protein